MKLYKEFNKLPRLVQILLLIIPFVNWLTEVVVRWSYVLNKKSTINLIVAVLVTVFGVFWGFVDVLWCLFFKHLTFVK